ncbi:MAG: Mu-like prophage major head subunit gpT family protein [Chloroflexi bacterium]|nr:Mu-like prophage major head subunit gpT family protein [Chloroflexota bacterium]
MKALLADLTQGHVIKGVGGERVQMGLSSREKMAYALDRLFELPIPDKAKDLPDLSGIREAYILITGDTGLRGFGYGDWERSVIAREANEVTTAIMNDLLGNVLNKKLVKDCEDQPKWWKKVVTETTIKDMKAQTRVLLGDFAVLPTVAENAAYANLAWSDTKETYTPVKKGSLVTVTMEAILNDDIRGITRIPRKLARAAGITMNEFIANLFTSNPLMADGFNVFDAANHQGNTGTTALSATSLMSAMVVLAKMADAAAKRLGIRGRWLLIPPDLEDTAYTACYSSLKPGTANNDKNILEGRADYIVVPQFTDVNDWFLVADPGEIECIEIGYLNGQRTPELLVQDDPTAGAVFTNDAIAYKIRWIFGGAWLDYRGAYRSAVV